MIINSNQSLEAAITNIREAYSKHKYISVKLDHQKRSIIQNSLQFHWYGELEKQGDNNAAYWRNYCKYHFGCAIRAAKDEYFAEVMRDTLRRYEYEDRIKMMSFIDVTSTFDREQMKQYLTTMRDHFADQGYQLTTSEDL